MIEFQQIWTVKSVEIWQSLFIQTKPDVARWTVNLVTAQGTRKAKTEETKRYQCSLKDYFRYNEKDISCLNRILRFWKTKDTSEFSEFLKSRPTPKYFKRGKTKSEDHVLRIVRWSFCTLIFDLGIFYFLNVSYRWNDFIAKTRNSDL